MEINSRIVGCMPAGGSRSRGSQFHGHISSLAGRQTAPGGDWLPSLSTRRVPLSVFERWSLSYKLPKELKLQNKAQM